MASEEHRRRAQGRTVRCFVITVSDTRTPETDTGGDLASRLLEEDGHQVVGRRIVPDEVDAIRGAVCQALDNPAVEAVILTGGTGIAPRDRTPEAVRPLLDRELPGFGELFRMLSYQQVGAAALLSRAFAGAAGRRFVACLPGSPKAVALAMERLILPEIRHILSELSRGAEGPSSSPGLAQTPTSPEGEGA